jgi:hypothetical protein
MHYARYAPRYAKEPGKTRHDITVFTCDPGLGEEAAPAWLFTCTSPRPLITLITPCLFICMLFLYSTLSVG